MTTENLTADLQEQVQDCQNSVVYLGATPIGEHTYFFHVMGEDGGEGYLSLPIAPEGEPFPRVDWNQSEVVIQVGPEKWFDLDGAGFIPSPFQYLIHVDLRKWHRVYKENAPYTDRYSEESILICCGGGSTLPARAAKAAGVDSKDSVPWAANFRIAPWELTEELLRASVAVTAVYPDDRRIVVL